MVQQTTIADSLPIQQISKSEHDSGIKKRAQK